MSDIFFAWVRFFCHFIITIIIIIIIIIINPQW